MAFMRPSLANDPLLHLRGSQVLLRPPRMADYSAWSHLRGLSRLHLMPFEPMWAYDELSRGAFRDRVRRYQSEIRSDQGYAFFAFTASNEELVGGISLSNVRRGVAQTASVGYWIGVPWTRRGYARDSLSIATKFAFEELRLHRLEAACMPSNSASLRTLESCRYRREGIAQRYLKIAGKWEDHVLFALTIEEWLEERR